jgi:hypothetical protein
MEDATAAQSLPSGNQVNDRHEDGSADDRPQDPEGMATDVDHQRLRQLELGCKPGPKECAYETEGYGNDKPAADVASDSPADGAADGRDYDEEYEPRQCDSHDKPLSLLD